MNNNAIELDQGPEDIFNFVSDEALEASAFAGGYTPVYYNPTDRCTAPAYLALLTEDDGLL